MPNEETVECPACGMDMSINETQCQECGYEIDEEDRGDAE